MRRFPSPETIRTPGPPAAYFLILIAMVVSYLYLVQVVKAWFIRRYGYE